MEKLTKVAKFNAIAEMVGADATFEDGSSIVEFLAHEVEMTEKRNKRKSSSPSKKSIANKEIAKKIREAILESDAQKLTATEVANTVGLSSPQKVVGVIKANPDAGIGTISEKRKTYYVATEE
jgi:hypothetical protein